LVVLTVEIVGAHIEILSEGEVSYGWRDGTGDPKKGQAQPYHMCRPHAATCHALPAVDASVAIPTT
jgi:hypothetical protein